MSWSSLRLRDLEEEDGVGEEVTKMMIMMIMMIMIIMMI